MQILGSTVSATSAVTVEEGAGTWLTFATGKKSPVLLSFWLLSPSLNPSSSPTYVWAHAAASTEGHKGEGVAQGGVWARLCLSMECLMLPPEVWGAPRGLGFGSATGGRQTVLGLLCLCRDVPVPRPPRVTAGGRGRERLQEPLLQLASTACSTSQLCCASLAGTCFSINLGGRESLAEPWAAGKDLQLLWLLCVLLAGLGLLQKCPGRGGDGGGNPCWRPSREQGPSQYWIRGAGGGRMNRDILGSPMDLWQSQGWESWGRGDGGDPHAGLEVGDSVQYGHS